MILNETILKQIIQSLLITNHSIKKFIKMKNIISVLLIIILFQSCAEESNTDTTIDLIKKVETGLTTLVYMEQ